MTTCDCGVETTRFKTTFDAKGNASTVCRSCHPEQFEKWVDPSNTHGGFRWQYEPQKYKKRELSDGREFYEATDERNADLEADLLKPSALDLKAQKALEERRRNRRTRPMSEAELKEITQRAHNQVTQARLQAKFGI